MKNNINKLFLLVMFAVTATSCLDDEVIDFGKGPIITQFSNKTVTNNFLQDGSDAVYEYEVPIEYRGGAGLALKEEVTITISVDAAASTATEGKEFSLPVTSFTIPAGSQQAFAKIMVNSAQLDALNPLTAVLQIESSSQTVSDSNKTVITLQAICPSALAGDYVFESARASKVGITIAVVSTGPGTYSVSEDPYFGGVYPIYISDVCGTITVTGGYLPDNFGIGVSGSGSVNETTGAISFSYTADGYFDNRSVVLLKK
jgi:hypothetical protein